MATSAPAPRRLSTRESTRPVARRRWSRRPIPLHPVRRSRSRQRSTRSHRAVGRQPGPARSTTAQPRWARLRSVGPARRASQPRPSRSARIRSRCPITAAAPIFKASTSAVFKQVVQAAASNVTIASVNSPNAQAITVLQDDSSADLLLHDQALEQVSAQSRPAIRRLRA